jgi:hypothetical protein
MMIGSRSRPASPLLVVACAAVLVATTVGTLWGGARKFFDDDPISKEPETQDASGAAPYEINLIWDLSYNLFANPARNQPRVRAKNLNTIDEVPDSSWFANRILSQPLSTEDVARGPVTGPGPTGRLTIVAPKSAGAAPGFLARDDHGTLWFVSFDAKGQPEGATSVIMVANKLFWALGYWQVENHLVAIRPNELAIADTAKWKPASGKRRKMHRDDLDDVLRRAHRSADGSYRAVAARGLPGKILEGFQYYGTRPDDPNDLVPHEHRRELRALKVFGAWTNLVDMKAGNTLDTVVQENGRGIVRHYLQDVGSTFGVGANGPRDYDEGWEHLYEGDPMWKRLVSLGFYLRPWQKADYPDYPTVGRFESEQFDPREWKPRIPTAAFLMSRADDEFWAARRVMAFSDEMVRAAVKAGGLSDPAAEKYLGDVLIARRDKIGRAYLPAVNPLVGFSLDANGALTFGNAAVEARVAEAPRGGYQADWFAFDNATGETRPIGEATRFPAQRSQAPPGLPGEPGAYVKVKVSAIDPPNPSWTTPVDVYFRRLADGWKLVGLERLPD